VIDIHVPIEASYDDVPELSPEECVLLPACLVPTFFAVDSSGWYMADEYSLHAAISQDLKLNAQPFQVFVPGFVFLCAAVNSRVGGEEVSAQVSLFPRDMISFATYMVFKLITASFPGITSTENHPPCWN
jgi:hypothetical protein